MRNWMMTTGLTALTFICLLPPTGEAQETPGSWEARAIVGFAGFLDERTDYRFVIGGAIRTYVSARVAIEPEFLYMREDESLEDFFVQANLVRDFTGTGRARPYLIGGIGIQHHREKFPGASRPSFSSNSLTGSGGAGVRIRVNDRFFLSPELRVGTEPLFRATVAIGGAFPK